MAEMNESAQVTPWETPGGHQPTNRAHHGLEERGKSIVWKKIRAAPAQPVRGI
jgi:hypothetical protein